MSEAFIIAGLRTPFIRAGTEFSGLAADDLGRRACAALLARTGIDPGLIDEVIMGCVAQPMDVMNVARVIGLRAGVPEHVPAVTVHRNCASGVEAVTAAAERLASGRGELFLVGGVESMSSVPLLFPEAAAAKFGAVSRAKGWSARARAAAGLRPSDFKPRPALLMGLTDPYSGLIMGDTAEVLAREFSISREAQDAFAAGSHAKALAARSSLDAEISPVYEGGKVIGSDNGVRTDSTEERLGRLRPIFDRRTGSVTAGNSSQVTDGAVALLVGGEAMARRLGIEPLGRLVSYAYAGCDPRRMGLGPCHAIARGGLDPERADVIEINEAFAAQVLAVLAALREPGRIGVELRAVELSPDQINRRGGAIALGHPVGASGARLVLTALDQLRERASQTALVTMCVGGGQGAALWLERP